MGVMVVEVEDMVQTAMTVTTSVKPGLPVENATITRNGCIPTVPRRVVSVTTAVINKTDVKNGQTAGSAKTTLGTCILIATRLVNSVHKISL